MEPATTTVRTRIPLETEGARHLRVTQAPSVGTRSGRITVTSLRWHYPDQVRRVCGRATLSAARSPSKVCLRRGDYSTGVAENCRGGSNIARCIMRYRFSYDPRDHGRGRRWGGSLPASHKGACVFAMAEKRPSRPCWVLEAVASVSAAHAVAGRSRPL
jgi:hypothetical protein